MASVNKVILVGNLGADPETRAFPSGDSVTNARLATTETWKDKNGETKEATEWHTLEFTGRLAEIAAQYLKKGSSVYVEGSIRTQKWQDKDGNDRYTTKIRVLNMQMLGGKPEGSGSRDGNNGGTPARQQQRPATSKPAQSAGAPDDKDVPF